MKRPRRIEVVHLRGEMTASFMRRLSQIQRIQNDRFAKRPCDLSRFWRRIFKANFLGGCNAS